MRATLESTSDAILVTDEKNEVVDFNDKFLDIWTNSAAVAEGRRRRSMFESSRVGTLRTRKHFSPVSQKLQSPDRRASTCSS